jgi:hypothetical protein
MSNPIGDQFGEPAVVGGLSSQLADGTQTLVNADGTHTLLTQLSCIVLDNRLV